MLGPSSSSIAVHNELDFEERCSSASSEYRTTKIRSPRTNGFVERMNRTLFDEYFRITGRTTWCLEPASSATSTASSSTTTSTAATRATGS